MYNDDDDDDDSDDKRAGYDVCLTNSLSQFHAIIYTGFHISPFITRYCEMNVRI